MSFNSNSNRPAGRAGGGLGAVVAAACLVLLPTVAPAQSGPAPSDGAVAASDVRTGAIANDAAASNGAVTEWIRELSDSAGAGGKLTRRRPDKKAGSAGLPRRSNQGSSAGLKYWWPTGIVLALIAVAVVFLKRWFPQARGAAGGPIKILARHHLSNKQSLCLIRLGDGIFLVGITPDRIHGIAQISDPEQVSSIIASTERGRQGSFTAAFERFAPGEAAVDAPGLEAEPPLMLPPGRLAAARSGVREVMGRVRAMSGSLGASAEPT